MHRFPCVSNEGFQYGLQTDFRLGKHLCPGVRYACCSDNAIDYDFGEGKKCWNDFGFMDWFAAVIVSNDCCSMGLLAL